MDAAAKDMNEKEFRGEFRCKIYLQSLYIAFPAELATRGFVDSGDST
jgi:hypothetical protein